MFVALHFNAALVRGENPQILQMDSFVCFIREYSPRAVPVHTPEPSHSCRMPAPKEMNDMHGKTERPHGVQPQLSKQ